MITYLTSFRFSLGIFLTLSTSFAMEQEEGINYLTTLPYELKENIFSYLTGPDLCAVACVDHDMNKAVNNSNAWKEMSLVLGLEDKPADISWKNYLFDMLTAKKIRLSILLPRKNKRTIKGSLAIKFLNDEFSIRPKYLKKPNRMVLTEDYSLRKIDCLNGAAYRYVRISDFMPAMNPQTAHLYNYDYNLFIENYYKEHFSEHHQKAEISNKELLENFSKLVSIRLNLTKGFEHGFIELGVLEPEKQ